jgi:shikimate dehydrogenase
MKKACVIGWPIAHSRSPLIHNYWLKKYGIEGSYTKVAVRPEELESFLGSLEAKGFVGCNVTVPHKEAAYQLTEFKDDSALAVEAANTIWRESNSLKPGSLGSANTDTYGFMTHLALSVPNWFKSNTPVSVLGAGGAARAIVYGLLQAGCGEVRVFNRSRERSDNLAQTFGPSVRVLDWDKRELASRDSSVLVNTTTLGMKDQSALDFDVSQLTTNCVVADIVYVPLETPLLKAARARGLKTVDGLGMLLHQAVPGFEKWFGVKPEVTAELRAIIEADILRST